MPGAHPAGVHREGSAQAKAEAPQEACSEPQRPGGPRWRNGRRRSRLIRYCEAGSGGAASSACNVSVLLTSRHGVPGQILVTFALLLVCEARFSESAQVLSGACGAGCQVTLWSHKVA